MLLSRAHPSFLAPTSMCVSLRTRALFVTSSRQLCVIAPFVTSSRQFYVLSRPLLLNLQPTSHVHQTISRPHLPEHTSRPSPADHHLSSYLRCPFFQARSRVVLLGSLSLMCLSLSLFLSFSLMCVCVCFSLSHFLSFSLMCVCVFLSFSLSKNLPLYTL
jgi:hypothetical protein